MDETSQDSEGRPAVRPDDVPRAADRDLVLRKEEAGAFLFDPQTSALHCLNEVGVQVWESLDGRRTVRDIARAVSERYEEADEETVVADVSAFVADLLDRSYATLEPAAGAEA